jgi:hypothetical protein
MDYGLRLADEGFKHKAKIHFKAPWGSGRIGRQSPRDLSLISGIPACTRMRGARSRLARQPQLLSEDVKGGGRALGRR